jgi:Rrf2 family protein
LALKEEPGPLSAKEIAEDQEVSVKYLEALLTALRKAGLVRSVRGAGGGYLLAKPPSEITVRDIFEVFEGTEGLVFCTNQPEMCDRSDICPTHEVWAEMFASCMDVLASWTVEDLAQRRREKGRALCSMYHI